MSTKEKLEKLKSDAGLTDAQFGMCEELLEAGGVTALRNAFATWFSAAGGANSPRAQSEQVFNGIF